MRFALHKSIEVLAVYLLQLKRSLLSTPLPAELQCSRALIEEGMRYE